MYRDFANLAEPMIARTPAVDRPPLDRFQRMALLTTLTTYALIMVGGLVRASGAGLGCPDWPMCFGLLIPPLEGADLPPAFDPAEFNVYKTWTEFINRLLGALTGLLILTTTVLAIRDHRSRPRVLVPTVLALILVIVTGWLGGRVVKTGLDPLTLTAHLTFALFVVSLLLYATVSAFFPRGPLPRVEPEMHRLGWLASGAAALVVTQVASGAFVRDAVQRVAESGVPRAEWLAHVGGVETAHQTSAVVVTAFVLWVSFLGAQSSSAQGPAVRFAHRWVLRASVGTVVLVVTQVTAGWGLVAFGFPRALQVVHLLFAALLMGSLTLLAMLAWRLEPEDARAWPGRGPTGERSEQRGEAERPWDARAWPGRGPTGERSEQRGEAERAWDARAWPGRGPTGERSEQRGEAERAWNARAWPGRGPTGGRS